MLRLPCFRVIVPSCGPNIKNQHLHRFVWHSLRVQYAIRSAVFETRGAKIGGVGGVATPPEFWKGGLNPP